MVVSHGVVLATALAALISAPYVIAVMMRSHDPTIREAWIRRARQDRPALHSLDRAALGTVPADAPLPSFEQVAAELNRLHRQRGNGTSRGSEKWLTAMGDAYDEWLRVACRHLAVSDHLSGLDGPDRDLERVRIEAELSAAGLELPPR
ncbi:MAG TPA: hypothetical protein VFR35_17530 [Actinoplanes sp.]|nr:hypothetical protein [Actinoplanes sp.]